MPKRDQADLTGGRMREGLVEDILQDFERRRQERKPWELTWQLNMNFVAGNQYCRITNRGDITDTEKEYEWQEREVFNHIAPILETRLAKLSRVRPRMSVVPAGGEDSDLLTARTATAVLDSLTDKLRFDDIVSEATMWSETCGTVFYKIDWDGDDVAITAVPPFEIYPDSSSVEELTDCRSVIHARAVPVSLIKDVYGVEVEGEDVNVFSTDGITCGGSRLLDTPRHDHAVVVEYYELPTKTYPDGRYAVIAGKTLLALSTLPYRNGANGDRTYPFVRQTSIALSGSLWGASVVERSIPVQRAYNAVKNRKHEFLNRLASGVLTVEDGSVDVDELAQDGLNPGKILVYRQGATPPRFMDTGRLPAELAQEEDKLLSEFIAISGVSELMRSGTVDHSINSGVALRLLIEQDDTRLAVTAEMMKSAIRRIAAHALRLYKQYATGKRMARVVGADGGVELTAWESSSITSDEIVFVAENQLSQTPAQKQQFVFDLLNTGLLTDEDGKMSNRMRAKLLDILGFGMWEHTKDVESLQIKRALKEQAELGTTPPVVKLYDDHELHVAEHVKYLLSGEFAKLLADSPALEAVLTEHVLEHKAKMMTQGEENVQTQKI